MSFVDQNATIFLDFVIIGGSSPHAHQEHTCTISKTKVHSSLKMNALSNTHLRVRNNVAGLYLCIHASSRLARAMTALFGPNYLVAGYFLAGY